VEDGAFMPLVDCESLSCYFSILYILGHQLLFFPLVISYHYSLFSFLLLIRCFLTYNSCVLGAPYTFNDISITYKKKKKKNSILLVSILH
jgi:hypothetical protein